MFVLSPTPAFAITEVVCDGCGNSCGEGIGQSEYATLAADWGYFSNRDGESHQCHLCEACFNKVEAFIQSFGGKVRNKAHEDWGARSELPQVIWNQLQTRVDTNETIGPNEGVDYVIKEESD